MAITTTKNNIMTLIQEDGSDPSGAGGKIINDNFKKIDDLFDGDDCKSAISLTQAPDIAKNTGFSNPSAQGASYRVTSGGVNYPVAIWGAEFQTGVYFEDSDHITMAPIAKLPPYGPFMYHVMAYVAANKYQDEGDYIECVVHGYDGAFHGAYDSATGNVTYGHSGSGGINTWNQGIAFGDVPNNPEDRKIFFGITNGTLYCGACMDGDEDIYNACIMHVTAIALYTDNTQFTTENIYYYE